LTRQSLAALIAELPIAPARRAELLALTPSAYVGLAARLARLQAGT
jgi:hypothetical protein